MATVVRMPAALAGTTEGAIQTWLAEVGQSIAVGEPLAEIETEKAVVEYAAEVAGTVGRLLAEPGRSIEVGAPIAVILAEGEGDAAADAALAGAAAGPAPAAPPVPTTAPAPTVAAVPAAPEPESASPAAPPAPDSAPIVAPPAPAARSEAPSPAAPAPDDSSSAHRTFASPIVRRLARERGIDLDALAGTGPGGRIVRRDLDAAPARPAAAPAAAPVAPAAAPTGPTSTPSAQASIPSGQATSIPAAPASALTPAASFTDVPLTGMRRAIARRLTESKTTVPHFYVTAHCRVDALLELRRQVNETASRKISVNDFVLKAVAGALVRTPSANAIWLGDGIRRFDGVDLAVAVAVEGGLLTPVIRGVDTLSLSAVASTVAELAERARAGRLQQHELEGGSFSVSNLGMYGVDEFSAILNPPQAGILAVGAAKPRPVVENGELAVGTVMTVTLSADHRVIDGAVAAEWMAAFVGLIENPVGILL